jgi:hypothetical protein
LYSDAIYSKVRYKLTGKSTLLSFQYKKVRHPESKKVGDLVVIIVVDKTQD